MTSKKGYLLEIGEKNLTLDGKPFYLASGEMHYFRFFKDGWKRRLKLMKDFSMKNMRVSLIFRAILICLLFSNCAIKWG